MFARSKTDQPRDTSSLTPIVEALPPSTPAPPAPTAPVPPAPTEPAASELAPTEVAAQPDPGRSLDQMLDRLQEAVGPASDTGGGALAEAVSEHADTLRATRDAQRQAQDMLAMATQVRSAASEEAEQIVREAEESARRRTEDADRHADQARREVAEWAAEQRSQVQSAIERLRASGTEDAERVRAETERAAMAEAEQTAKAYLSEAVARGTRDAEAIRAQARELLERCNAQVVQAGTSLHDIAATAAGLTNTLQRQAVVIEELIAEVGLPDPPVPTAGRTQSTPQPAASSIPPPPPTDGEARPLGSLFRVPDPAED